jgi:hypothetical protein
MERSPSPSSRLLHEDRAARLAWAGAAVSLLACVASSAALLYFGWVDVPLWPGAGLGVFPPWVLPFLLIVGWMGSVGYASWAATQACLRVDLVGDGSLAVTRQYPFRVKTVTVPADAVAPAWLVECTDSDGEVRFRAEVPRPGGGHLVLGVFATREACQALCSRYNAALGLEGRGWARGGDR